MTGENKYPIITISRQYGAGGHSVARGISERLGLEYYDFDFVRMTAKNSGYSEEEIRQVGEEMSSGSWFVNAFINPSSLSTSAHDEVYKAEREVILDLGKKGSCIIVGRCANAVLRDFGIPTFDIFLYADLETRIKRAKELGENGRMSVERFVEHRDHYRNTYYKNYTGHELGDYRDYNICIDTGTIGIDRSVDIICDILEKK